MVPPSLALAQAAVESAWGTSRFALEANALFGQQTESAEGMAPQGDGLPAFRIAVFDSLADCVDAYLANLNSHPAYRAFRKLRAAERTAGGALDGRALAATLAAYSETGSVYTGTLKKVIDDNGLAAWDAARLADDSPVVVLAAR